MENKGGRPKKQIDKNMFETMCGIQCTKDEICAILDLDEKTLTRWCNDTYGMGFSDIYKNKSQVGKMSLRRIQYKLAEKNPTMAIWLGKQYLNQRDRQEIVAEVENKNNYKELSVEELKKLAGE